METFAPLINLLVLLSTLSIAAERLANLLKPRHTDRRASRDRMAGAGEKERERRIGNRALVVSVLLAVAVKADFFAIVSQLDAPWETLGWTGNAPINSPAELLTTIAGTIVTGLSLGFAPSSGTICSTSCTALGTTCGGTAVAPSSRRTRIERTGTTAWTYDHIARPIRQTSPTWCSRAPRHASASSRCAQHWAPGADASFASF